MNKFFFVITLILALNCCSNKSGETNKVDSDEVYDFFKSRAVELHSNNFDSLLKAESENLLVLVYYTKRDSTSLKIQTNIYNATNDKQQSIKFGMINGDVELNLVNKSNLNSLPTMQFYHKNRLLYTVKGILSSKDLSALFTELLKQQTVSSAINVQK